MLADRHLPVIIQFCYFFRDIKMKLKLKILELAKTGLILMIKALELRVVVRNWRCHFLIKTLHGLRLTRFNFNFGINT